MNAAKQIQQTAERLIQNIPPLVVIVGMALLAVVVIVSFIVVLGRGNK